jgi:hypothetical protein
MDENGVRQPLEIFPPQDFKGSFDAMVFTGESVHAAETPSTERLLQDVSCPPLLLQICTTGIKTYYCGPLHNDRKLILKWVGHCMEYSVEEARAKAECLAKNIPLGTIPQSLRVPARTCGIAGSGQTQRWSPHG